MARSNWDGLLKLQKNLDNLSKTKSVQFSDLFDSEFMSRNTHYSSIEDFLKAGGFNIESMDDFLSIPEEKLDLHVRQSTSFQSWDEMKKTAGQLWIKKQMGL